MSGDFKHRHMPMNGRRSGNAALTVDGIERDPRHVDGTAP